MAGRRFTETIAGDVDSVTEYAKANLHVVWATNGRIENAASTNAHLVIKKFGLAYGDGGQSAGKKHVVWATDERKENAASTNAHLVIKKFGLAYGDGGQSAGKKHVVWATDGKKENAAVSCVLTKK
ncbi:uncharacterized protein LOC135497711 [Lineus longissimus]|uniref:uncharacterized protein LOC135497711 n=1 Tax=Lineus longissimus TaxID=88925 RepID=UPI00315DEFB2